VSELGCDGPKSERGWLATASITTVYLNRFSSLAFQLWINICLRETMARIERIREVVSVPFDEGYFSRKLREGWRLVAVHWERELEGAAPGPTPWTEDVPYGLRVADDCIHLEENPAEKRTMETMLKLISSDKSMSQIAGELNTQGFRTRSGTVWTQTAVFNMLPRLIEAAPHIWRSSAAQH
jgi:hypothetical protein